MRCMRVDLPDPDGPMMVTNSPVRTRERHPADRVHGAAALHVGLRGVEEFDHVCPSSLSPGGAADGSQGCRLRSNPWITTPATSAVSLRSTPGYSQSPLRGYNTRATRAVSGT